MDNLNLRHKQVVVSDSSITRFIHSNDDGDSPAFFKFLVNNDVSLVIGGRNVMYNFSMPDMKVIEKIEWYPQKGNIDECIMKGKRKFECANFIRAVIREPNGKITLCGTHAYSPKCRRFDALENSQKLREIRQDFDGQAIVPFSPNDNATAVFIPEVNALFTATVSDFDGTDPLIFRKKLETEGPLRTPKDDFKVIDDAQFVKSFPYGDYIYFFFRELAAEANDNNNEKQVYSRIGRVCKTDNGGNGPFRDRWTTFTKVRLNCSLPGDSPFYFNELQSITEPTYNSDHSSDVIYGTFSTPYTTVHMSAVCVYKMKDIEDIFDNSFFKYQPTSDSSWRPYFKINKNNRPGQCNQDMSKTNEISFVVRNPLLYDTVKPIYNKPIFAHGPDKFTISSIAIAPQVKTVNIGSKDVIYLGTTDGKIMKIVDNGDRKQMTVFIQTSKVFSSHEPITYLNVINNGIFALSNEMAVSLPLYNCDQAKSCAECVRLQDPHCIWDTNIDMCLGYDSRNIKSAVQSVSSGFSEICPNGHILQDELYAISDSNEKGIDEFIVKTGGYSFSNILIVGIITFIIAIIFGFVVGYHVSQRQDKTNYQTQHSSGSSSGGSSSDYDSYGRARLTKHDGLSGSKIDHVYSSGPGSKNMDAVSLILNMNQNAAAMPMLGTYTQVQSGATTPRIEKNVMNCTLPRDYKVKKVYL
uniref:Semaphorin-1A (projected from Caenorhabditis elegans ortholog smp-1) n=1 Tax=Strongyloides venezuelensis TaxID=75913 RepID=A0A0K0F6M3_STRVS